MQICMLPGSTNLDSLQVSGETNLAKKENQMSRQPAAMGNIYATHMMWPKKHSISWAVSIALSQTTAYAATARPQIWG